MGDFLAFKLDKWSESLDDNGYSRLLKLRFQTFLGHEEKDPILIDLSMDCDITQPGRPHRPGRTGFASRGSSRAITSSIRFLTSWQTSCAP